MNPPMYRRVRNMLFDSHLTDDYSTQYLSWRDTGKLAERFIVFRPNGGTAVDRDLSSEYYVLVDLISGKSTGDYEKSAADAQAIIDCIQANPISNPCVGQITNMGGIPAPVQTTEGRMVWRLQFACLYGE